LKRVEKNFITSINPYLIILYKLLFILGTHKDESFIILKSATNLNYTLILIIHFIRRNNNNIKIITIIKLCIS